MNIYFDHNSTTMPADSVRTYFKSEFGKVFANPSSSHLAGRDAKQKLSSGVTAISEILNVSPTSLSFNSGATESINTILNFKNLTSLGIENVISSPLEHNATLSCLKNLGDQGIGIHLIKNDENGLMDLEHAVELMKQYPRSLVSVVQVNNETGIVNDVGALSALAKQSGCLLHIDAAQSIGKVALSLANSAVDFASFSGHKFGSIKGVGFLYCREVKKVSPLMLGESPEDRLRPGTVPYDSIQTVWLALNEILKSDPREVAAVRDYFEKSLSRLPVETKINSVRALRAPNTSNVWFDRIPNEVLLMALSEKGIYVSSGSACSSGSLRPSHVLLGMRKSVDYCRSCIRFSFGRANTLREVDLTIDAISEIVNSYLGRTPILREL